MNAKTAVINYRRACEDIVTAFLNKYFEDYDFPDDVHFIGGQCDGVVNTGDFYFNVGFMHEALLYEATWEQVYEYYNAELEHALSDNGDKPMPVNFKNFVKWGWMNHDK